ncbi:MAG: alpha/beta fold hydrolase, partial [Myxococcales bacterium]|nr:alpha/beta fold hydrolase [Myxococcales bacterium]
AGDAGATVADGDAPERWGGRIQVPPEVPLEFELRLRCGPPPSAVLAIPAQQLAPTPVVDVTCTAEEIKFVLALPGMSDEAKARFELERAADGTAHGVLHQLGRDLRVDMRRLADGEEIGAAPARPQNPKPPFPYVDRAASYASADGTTLAGTLSVPPGGGRHPAVVLITGTGTQDRDETLFGHKPFWVLADHLARAGVAVLRVDDRGAGGSGGDTGSVGLGPKVEDVVAGMAWLATQPDIDPARIGLVGHSEGGVIAPMVAARAAPGAPPVAFMVLWGAPGVPGTEIAAHQVELLGTAAGMAGPALAARVASTRRLNQLAVDGADEPTLRAALNEELDRLAALSGETLDDASRAREIAASLPPLLAEASRSFLATDPAPYLREVRCPVLALWGSLDLQVDPDQNQGPLRAALADDADVTTEVLPGLNHLLQPAQRGTIDEYATIETTMAPAALDRITGWVRAHAGVAAP